MSKRSHDGDAPPQLKAMLDDLKREVMQNPECLNNPESLDTFGYNFFSSRRSSFDLEMGAADAVKIQAAAAAAAAAADEDEDDVAPEGFLPPGFNPKRRKSGVWAEALDMTAARSYTPVMCDKDAETAGKLMTAMRGLIQFREVAEEDLDKVVGAMFCRHLGVGETVITQGEAGDNFYVVGSGLFDCYVNGVHVAEFDGHGSFGELALMHNCARAATILSVGAGVVWGLDRQTFRSIVLGVNASECETYEKALERNPLMQDLSHAERVRLTHAMEKKVFDDGTVVIRQGDEAQAMYLITAGEAKVTRHLDHTQKEMEITTLGEGQYFGEVAILTHKPRAASVIAKSNLTCARISRTSFERLLGPCVDIMKRHAGGYEERLRQLFGPAEGSSYLGLELAGL